MKENGITRREAVERVGALSAAGVLMTTPHLALVPSDNLDESTGLEENPDIHKMRCDDWKKFIDQGFDILGLSFAANKKIRKTNVRLIEVEDHSHESDKIRPKHIRQSGYSLVFEAPLGTNLESRTHVIRHSQLGKCHFHLQRVYRGKDHMEAAANNNKNQFYEAVIN